MIMFPTEAARSDMRHRRRYWSVAGALLCALLLPSVSAAQGEIDTAKESIQGLINDLRSMVATGGFPGPARAGLYARQLNLQAVLDALNGATIQLGITPPGFEAITSFAPNGAATVTLSGVGFTGAPTAAIAQALAHEAIHIIDAPFTNDTRDEEYLAFKKEAEVWDALKQPGDTDKSCETTSNLNARGEAALRTAISAAYAHLPQSLPD